MDGGGLQVVVEANICWRLVELLKHRSWRVTKPALRTIGNIVCAEDEVDYTQHIIEAGAVPCLRELIAHSNRCDHHEARSSPLPRPSVSSNPLSVCICLPGVRLCREIQKEACWTLSNIAAGTCEQIQTVSE